MYLFYKKSRFVKIICVLLVFLLVQTSLQQVQAQDTPFLASPHNYFLDLSAPFSLPVLRGMRVYPSKPFKFDFMVGSGDRRTINQKDASLLIKYFLTCLTIPEEDLWVNLSPYEHERMIPNELAKTDAGNTLLLQDKFLKQLASSLTYPESKLGKKFWALVYKKAYEKFGTTNLPVNTYNKVWIVPSKAIVYDMGDSAFIGETHLKVMLDEDYVAYKKHSLDSNFNLPVASGKRDELQQLSASITREIILPELEKEINEGKNFAPVRQIFHSMILAAWFKRALKRNVLSLIYVNKKKVYGIDGVDGKAKEEIYKQYLRIYKVGAYNYIREDVDPISQQVIPRKYFSGGFAAGNPAMWVKDLQVANAATLVPLLARAKSTDLAMAVAEVNLIPKTKGAQWAWSEILRKLAKGPAAVKQGIQDWFKVRTSTTRVFGLVVGLAVGGSIMAPGTAQAVDHRRNIDGTEITRQQEKAWENEHRGQFEEGRSIRNKYFKGETSAIPRALEFKGKGPSKVNIFHDKEIQLIPKILSIPLPLLPWQKANAWRNFIDDHIIKDEQDAQDKLRGIITGGGNGPNPPPEAEILPIEEYLNSQLVGLAPTLQFEDKQPAGTPIVNNPPPEKKQVMEDTHIKSLGKGSAGGHGSKPPEKLAQMAGPFASPPAPLPPAADQTSSPKPPPAPAPAADQTSSPKPPPAAAPAADQTSSPKPPPAAAPAADQTSSPKPPPAPAADTPSAQPDATAQQLAVEVLPGGVPRILPPQVVTAGAVEVKVVPAASGAIKDLDRTKKEYTNDIKNPIGHVDDPDLDKEINDRTNELAVANQELEIAKALFAKHSIPQQDLLEAMAKVLKAEGALNDSNNKADQNTLIAPEHFTVTTFNVDKNGGVTKGQAFLQGDSLDRIEIKLRIPMTITYFQHVEITIDGKPVKRVFFNPLTGWDLTETPGEAFVKFTVTPETPVKPGTKVKVTAKFYPPGKGLDAINAINLGDTDKRQPIADLDKKEQISVSTLVGGRITYKHHLGDQVRKGVLLAATDHELLHKRIIEAHQELDIVRYLKNKIDLEREDTINEQLKLGAREKELVDLIAALELQEKNCYIYAPNDGVITHTAEHESTVAAANQEIFQILPSTVNLGDTSDLTDQTILLDEGNVKGDLVVVETPDRVPFLGQIDDVVDPISQDGKLIKVQSVKIHVHTLFPLWNGEPYKVYKLPKMEDGKIKAIKFAGFQTESPAAPSPPPDVDEIPIQTLPISKIVASYHTPELFHVFSSQDLRGFNRVAVDVLDNKIVGHAERFRMFESQADQLVPGGLQVGVTLLGFDYGGKPNFFAGPFGNLYGVGGTLLQSLKHAGPGAIAELATVTGGNLLDHVDGKIEKEKDVIRAETKVERLKMKMTQYRTINIAQKLTIDVGANQLKLRQSLRMREDFEEALREVTDLFNAGKAKKLDVQAVNTKMSDLQIKIDGLIDKIRSDTKEVNRLSRGRGHINDPLTANIPWNSHLVPITPEQEKRMGEALTADDSNNFMMREAEAVLAEAKRLASLKGVDKYPTLGSADVTSKGAAPSASPYAPVPGTQGQAMSQGNNEIGSLSITIYDEKLNAEQKKVVLNVEDAEETKEEVQGILETRDSQVVGHINTIRVQLEKAVNNYKETLKKWQPIADRIDRHLPYEMLMKDPVYLALEEQWEAIVDLEAEAYKYSTDLWEMQLIDPNEAMISPVPEHQSSNAQDQLDQELEAEAVRLAQEADTLMALTEKRLSNASNAMASKAQGWKNAPPSFIKRNAAKGIALVTALLPLAAAARDDQPKKNRIPSSLLWEMMQRNKPGEKIDPSDQMAHAFRKISDAMNIWLTWKYCKAHELNPHDPGFLQSIEKTIVDPKQNGKVRQLLLNYIAGGSDHNVPFVVRMMKIADTNQDQDLFDWSYQAFDDLMLKKEVIKGLRAQLAKLATSAYPGVDPQTVKRAIFTWLATPSKHLLTRLAKERFLKSDFWTPEERAAIRNELKALFKKYKEKRMDKLADLFEDMNKRSKALDSRINVFSKADFKDPGVLFYSSTQNKVLLEESSRQHADFLEKSEWWRDMEKYMKPELYQAGENGATELDNENPGDPNPEYPFFTLQITPPTEASMDYFNDLGQDLQDEQIEASQNPPEVGRMLGSSRISSRKLALDRLMKVPDGPIKVIPDGHLIVMTEYLEAPDTNTDLLQEIEDINWFNILQQEVGLISDPGEARIIRRFLLKLYLRKHGGSDMDLAWDTVAVLRLKHTSPTAPPFNDPRPLPYEQYRREKAALQMAKLIDPEYWPQRETGLLQAQGEVLADPKELDLNREVSIAGERDDLKTIHDTLEKIRAKAVKGSDPDKTFIHATDAFTARIEQGNWEFEKHSDFSKLGIAVFTAVVSLIVLGLLSFSSMGRGFGRWVINLFPSWAARIRAKKAASVKSILMGAENGVYGDTGEYVETKDTEDTKGIKDDYAQMAAQPFHSKMSPVSPETYYKVRDSLTTWKNQINATPAILDFRGNKSIKGTRLDPVRPGGYWGQVFATKEEDKEAVEYPLTWDEIETSDLPEEKILEEYSLRVVKLKKRKITEDEVAGIIWRPDNHLSDAEKKRDYDSIMARIQQARSGWVQRDNLTAEEMLKSLNLIQNNAFEILRKMPYSSDLMWTEGHQLNEEYMKTFNYLFTLSDETIKGLESFLEHGEKTEAQREEFLIYKKQMLEIMKYVSWYLAILKFRAIIEEVLSYKYKDGTLKEFIYRKWIRNQLLLQVLLDIGEKGLNNNSVHGGGVRGLVDMGNELMPGMYKNPDSIVRDSAKRLRRVIRLSKKGYSPLTEKDRQALKNRRFVSRFLSVTIFWLSTCTTVVLGLLRLGAPTWVSLAVSLLTGGMTFFNHWLPHLRAKQMKELEVTESAIAEHDRILSPLLREDKSDHRTIQQMIVDLDREKDQEAIDKELQRDETTGRLINEPSADAIVITVDDEKDVSGVQAHVDRLHARGPRQLIREDVPVIVVPSQHEGATGADIYESLIQSEQELAPGSPLRAQEAFSRLKSFEDAHVVTISYGQGVPDYDGLNAAIAKGVRGAVMMKQREITEQSELDDIPSIQGTRLASHQENTIWENAPSSYGRSPTALRLRPNINLTEDEVVRIIWRDDNRRTEGEKLRDLDKIAAIWQRAQRGGGIMINARDEYHGEMSEPPGSDITLGTSRVNQDQVKSLGAVMTRYPRTGDPRVNQILEKKDIQDAIIKEKKEEIDNEFGSDYLSFLRRQGYDLYNKENEDHIAYNRIFFVRRGARAMLLRIAHKLKKNGLLEKVPHDFVRDSLVLMLKRRILTGKRWTEERNFYVEKRVRMDDFKDWKAKNKLKSDKIEDSGASGVRMSKAKKRKKDNKSTLKAIYQIIRAESEGIKINLHLQNPWGEVYVPSIITQELTENAVPSAADIVTARQLAEQLTAVQVTPAVTVVPSAQVAVHPARVVRPSASNQANQALIFPVNRTSHGGIDLNFQPHFIQRARGSTDTLADASMANLSDEFKGFNFNIVRFTSSLTINGAFKLMFNLN